MRGGGGGQGEEEKERRALGPKFTAPGDAGSKGKTRPITGWGACARVASAESKATRRD